MKKTARRNLVAIYLDHRCEGTHDFIDVVHAEYRHVGAHVEVHLLHLPHVTDDENTFFIQNR